MTQSRPGESCVAQPDAHSNLPSHLSPGEVGGSACRADGSTGASDSQRASCNSSDASYAPEALGSDGGRGTYAGKIDPLENSLTIGSEQQGTPSGVIENTPQTNAASCQMRLGLPLRSTDHSVEHSTGFPVPPIPGM